MNPKMERIEGQELLTENSGQNHEETEESDKNRRPGSYVYIIFFYLLGTVCFIPLGFYVTANEYWMYKFRDPTVPFNQSDTANKTALQKKFTAYAGMTMGIGMVGFIFVTILFAKRIALHLRIIGGMISMLTFLVVTLLFIFVNTDSWQEGFFVVALGTGALLSASSAVLMISAFQLVSKFPARCIAAQFAGQSISGIFSALIQVIALLAAPSVKATACLFYTVPIITIGGTMIAFLVMSDKYEDFRRKLMEQDPDTGPRPKIEFAMIKRVLRKMALLLVSILLAMGTTMILHSGLTSLIESSGKGSSVWSDTYFVPVCVFLSFNTFEFIGREVSNHIPLLKNMYVIFVTSVVRLAFFPLILLCNLQPRHHLPVVFHDDAFFIIFVIVLAISNGYISNISLIVLPEIFEPEEKNIGTGLIMVSMIMCVLLFSVLGGVFVNLI